MAALTRPGVYRRWKILKDRGRWHVYEMRFAQWRFLNYYKTFEEARGLVALEVDRITGYYRWLWEQSQ